MRMLLTSLLSSTPLGDKIYYMTLILIFPISLIFLSIITIYSIKKDPRKANSNSSSVGKKSYTETSKKCREEDLETPKKKHGERCDGDCKNCPPHYGYRHGRWYYGHNHIEGCVFGGNKGGGGRD